MARPNLKLKRRVIHVELPVSMWRKFAHWYIEQGYGNLTEAVKGLIRESTK